MDISANALSSGIGTIQSGQRRVEQAAAEIAGNAVSAPQALPTPPQNQVNAAPQSGADNRPDLAQSLVELRVGQHQAQAGARLVQTADEVLGTLIDTSA
jgi:hypothetical protein